MARVYTFFDIDMRMSQVGLVTILQKEKVKLNKGDMGVFVNSKKTIIKIMTENLQTMLVHRQERKIDPAIIPHLPAAFNGKDINFAKAVRQRIEKFWARKGYRVQTQ